MYNIKISEIPEYLRSSKFFSNLSENSLNDDFIYVEFYKSNTSINNPNDFILLIKAVDYWDADTPNTIWEYGFENQQKISKLIKTLLDENLQIKYKCLTDNVICVNSIVKNSNPNALKIFLEHFHIVKDDDYKACTIAVQNNDLESLKILKKYNFPLDWCLKHDSIEHNIYNICEFASKYNSLQCLIYGIENNCPLRNSIYNALIYNSVNIIEYFYSNFQSEVERILSENDKAIKDIFLNDSLDTIKFLHSKKIKLNKYFNCGLAIRYGSYKCLEFMFLTLKFNVKLSDIEQIHHNTTFEIYDNHIKCLKFLSENNLMNHEKRKIKIFYEHINYDLKLLDYIINMNINFDYDELFEYARQKNNIILMMKLHKELNIPFPKTFASLVPKNKVLNNFNAKKSYNGKFACFEYIRDNF